MSADKNDDEQATDQGNGLHAAATSGLGFLPFRVGRDICLAIGDCDSGIRAVRQNIDRVR